MGQGSWVRIGRRLDETGDGSKGMERGQAGRQAGQHKLVKGV